MRARCPHCTSVFTTDRGGVQYCPSCGKQIDVPPPVGPPPAAAPPPAEPPPEHETPPWERRRQVGFFAGYLGTLRDSCFSPNTFWRRLPPGGSWHQALLYGWLTSAVSQLIALPLMLAQLRMQATAVTADPEVPPELARWVEIATTPGFIGGTFLGSLLLYPLFFVAGAGLLHVMLMIVGGAKNGFEATARVTGYATGPLLVAAVPCIGAGGLMYFLVLLGWGFSAVHRAEWWRSAVALLLLTGLGCCCSIGVLIAAVAIAGSP